jgi:hypothetical protein
VGCVGIAHLRDRRFFRQLEVRSDRFDFVVEKCIVDGAALQDIWVPVLVGREGRLSSKAVIMGTLKELLQTSDGVLVGVGIEVTSKD